MEICPNCGATNPEGSKFCAYCGSNMHPNATAVQPVENSYSYEQGNVNNSSVGYNYTQNNYTASNFYQAVQPVSTGGLMAWSIITAIMCSPIFGLIAIGNASKINKATTVEEQQKRIKSTKTWCIVGNVVAALFLLMSLAGNM